MHATGVYVNSNSLKSKSHIVRPHTLSIKIPASARAALTSTVSPPLSPPMLSSSASSTTSFESLPEIFNAVEYFPKMKTAKGKPAAGKKAAAKPVEVKKAAVKPVEAKPVSGKKATKAKPTPAKPIEVKPVAAKPAPTKTVVSKPVAPKQITVKSVAAKLAQQFFFPNQTHFECVVPTVTSATSVHLKDFPAVQGEFAEYDRLYNADSKMTVDGRFMVRLL
ncbi:hypothetical protein BGZ94_003852 [Podila epigama]|nr:hypothetical protein BGZ94_003852 [Podila epigama]